MSPAVGEGVFTKPTLHGMAFGVNVVQWVLDADHTHYRVLLVRLPGPFGDPQDMYPPDLYAMVEPANQRRVWLPLNDPTMVSEEYIREKTHCTGADSRNLTTLLAAALDVDPIYLEATP